jgi:hypothetical protein
MISSLIARKAITSASKESAAPTPTNPDSTVIQDRTEPTLADIGARLGEDNEALRNS